MKRTGRRSAPYMPDVPVYHIRNDMPRTPPQPAFPSIVRRARAMAVSRCST